MDENKGSCKSCDIKEAHHSENIKKDLSNRLKKIEGQIRGINKMIEENIYCDDVLNQITSVKSALNGVSKMLLEAHIKSCVVEQIKNGEDEVVEELMETIKKMLK